MQVQHYEILHNESGYLAAKVNLAAFSVKILRNSRPSSESVIAFNTNYFWAGKPIGIISFDNKPLASIPSKGVRPLIRVGKAVFEAGPLLIHDGQICWRKGAVDGQFRDDLLRRARHVGCGWTKAGKLILVYKENVSIPELAKIMLGLGCIEAINTDGGHSAYLKVGKIEKGTKPLVVGAELFFTDVSNSGIIAIEK